MKTYAELWEQYIQAGLALSLNHFSIIELWTSCKANWEQRKVIEKEIENAVIAGELQAVILLRDPDSEGGYRKLPTERWRFISDGRYDRSYVSYEIHRDDFQDWLKRTSKWPLSDNCLLSFWWQNQTQITEACKGRRQEQVEEIVKTARSIGYDLKAIPDGGKGTIKAECLKNKGLFTNSGFDHAWKKAKKPPYEIQIENHERYSPRKK